MSLSSKMWWNIAAADTGHGLVKHFHWTTWWSPTVSDNTRDNRDKIMTLTVRERRQTKCQWLANSPFAQLTAHSSQWLLLLLLTIFQLLADHCYWWILIQFPGNVESLCVGLTLIGSKVSLHKLLCTSHYLQLLLTFWGLFYCWNVIFSVC